MTPYFLSAHFSLAEATTSDTAARLGIDNSHPPQEVLDVAIKTATRMEYVRMLLSSPIHINSWLRCIELNRALKSSDTSQHIKGEAVDFICPEFGSPVNVCKHLLGFKRQVDFDQLILEHTWVHISWSALPNAKQRGQVLSLLESGKYAIGLTNSKGIPYV